MQVKLRDALTQVSSILELPGELIKNPSAWITQQMDYIKIFGGCNRGISSFKSSSRDS